MIIGGKVKEVTAKKNKDEPAKQFSVNVNIKNFEKKQGRAVVEYEYTIKYLPDVAEIKITGEVYAEEDEKAMKEIEDAWKKKKVLPARFSEDLLAFLTYTGSTIGTLLAYSVNITAPVNVPRARLQEEPKAG